MRLKSLGYCDSVSRRSSLFQIKASSSEEASGVDAGEVFADLKEKVKLRIGNILIQLIIY